MTRTLTALLPAALAGLALSAGPAAASPSAACMALPPGSGLTVEFGSTRNQGLLGTPDLQALNDLQNLRLQGVNATRAERWQNCIRAYVIQPDGTERMEYFAPGSYQRIQ